MSNFLNKLGKAAIAMATLFGAQQAHAAGTTAGTTVTNTATVNYSISGTPQTAVNGVATFLVDRKINVVVAEGNTADTDVVPGATNQYVTFTVTNDSNDTIDVGLTALADLTTGPRGNTANFTATNVRIYVDANANGTFEIGSDTLISRIDALEPTVTGNTTAGIRTVFIVADIPAGLANNDVEVVSLTAEARQNDGNNATLGAVFASSTGVADDPNAVQNVFSDGDGPATDDTAAGDGKHSDDDAFKVVVTALTVEKVARVVSHPEAGGGPGVVTTNPKAIPGAVIEYCIRLTNTGAVAATPVSIGDVLPATVTYETGTLRSNATTSVCADANTVESDADNPGGDDGDGFGANYNAGTTTVSGAITSIPAGAARALRFNVKIK